MQVADKRKKPCSSRPRARAARLDRGRRRILEDRLRPSIGPTQPQRRLAATRSGARNPRIEALLAVTGEDRVDRGVSSLNHLKRRQHRLYSVLGQVVEHGVGLLADCHRGDGSRAIDCGSPTTEPDFVRNWCASQAPKRPVSTGANRDSIRLWQAESALIRGAASA